MSLEAIRGNAKVWVNEVEGKDGADKKLFSITVGQKQEDGTYINASLPVTFSSKVEVAKITHGCEIKIKDAWLSAYPTSRQSKNGKTINAVKLFINEAQIISAVETEESIKAEWTKEYNDRKAGLSEAKVKALKTELAQKYQPRIDALKPKTDSPFADDLFKM